MLNEASSKFISSSIHPDRHFIHLASVYFIITYIKERIKIPLKLDGQWPRTVTKYSVVKLPLNPDEQWPRTVAKYSVVKFPLNPNGQ
jgi:hypothetical protein